MRYLVLLILCTATATGCSSATKEIHQDAGAVTEHAHATIALAETLGPETVETVGPAIIAEQEKIIDLAGSIQENTTRVKDITPWWATLLGKIAAAAVAIAVLLLLWQTGVGYLLRRILVSFGLFIPRAKRAHVADSLALGEGNTLVEQRRLKDPGFDAAYRQEMKKRARLEKKLNGHRD